MARRAFAIFAGTRSEFPPLPPALLGALGIIQRMQDRRPQQNPASAEWVIRKFQDRGSSSGSDQLAVEEPLEIRVTHGPVAGRTTQPVAITMRTPTIAGGHADRRAVPHDFELAIGFLFSEGIVRSPRDIERVLFCGPETPPFGLHNVVRVELSPDAAFDAGRLQRNFFTNSSCGICGKTTLAAIQTLCPTPISDEFEVSPDLLCALPEFLREAQDVFDRTGGLHAAALFDLNGKLLALREDVGRHNALDKLIGSQFPPAPAASPDPGAPDGNPEPPLGPPEQTFACDPAAGNPFPLARRVLLVSGRASFELLQKTAMAGIPLFAAVGAPSSLAVDLARQFNITLVGFLRGNRFNVYSGESRISSATTPVRAPPPRAASQSAHPAEAAS